MKMAKVFPIADVLVKSQLRSGRSGRFSASLLNRPAAVLVVDVVAFLVSAGIAGRAIPFLLLSPIPGLSLDAIAREVLVLLPAIIPPMVFVASLLFELNVSSRFAASDTLNWLPVSQAEYVTASSLAVSFIYSFLPAVILGATLPIAWNQGLFAGWLLASLLSLVTLFIGALLVEILRATLNRVSTSAMKMGRRGALIARLAISVGLIVVFQFLFNPFILLGLLTALRSDSSGSYLIPFLWPSSAVRGFVYGGGPGYIVFVALTAGFAAFMTWAAVRVRSRFWSPYPASVTVSRGEYAPTMGALRGIGLSAVVSAIIWKDIRSLTRRREMVPFLAIPFVMLVAFLIPQYANVGSAQRTPPQLVGFPLLILEGIFALIFSTVSVGQEGKAIANIYSLPVEPKEYLRAKTVVSLAFSLAFGAGIIGISPLLLGLKVQETLPVFLLAPAVALEETFIGLGFATRFPDFAERPRPRFVRPLGMLLALPAGLAIAVATGSPLLVSLAVETLPGESGSLYGVPLALALVFSAAVTILAYRWAKRGIVRLLQESPV